MNLFKKTTAAVALVTLVSGIFSTGVSAYSTSEVGAANALAEAGIINNHSDNSAAYNLDQNVLRQEIAAVARGIAGLPKATTYSAVFSDVTATTPNTWAWASVNALADAGLVAKNPTFRPEANISKAEAVGMVVKAAFGDAYAFDAAKGTTWQEQVVAFAVENGVVSSFTNYDTAATRGFVFEAGANALSSDDDSMDGLLEDLLGGLTDDEETTTDDETTVTTPVVDGDDMLEVALSPETPTLGYVAAGRDRTTVLAFDVTAGSEDVTLKEATLEYVGLSDADDLDVLAIYLGNEKATKGTSKSFSNNESDLAFENDTVIKAGETQTLYVTANVASSTGTVSHKVALTNLEASSTVEGDYVVSNSFGVVNSNNVATLDLDINTESSKVTLGEETTLADFSLEEKNDKEDVTVKALTFEFSGFDAEDDLSDVVLYAEGKVIASDLMVNSDDEVVVNLDYTISQDETVDFELQWVVTGSINETLTAKLTDIYAVGAKTWLMVSLSGDSMSSVLLSNARNIEGSEINLSFDKSDIDEAKPNAEGVLVGTLKLSAVSDYTIDALEVTVTATSGTEVENVVQTIELNGSSSDSDTTSTASNVAVYTFEDIALTAGEEKELDLTFDIVDNTALNGKSLTFAVKVAKVTDEENDETYSGSALSTVLSTNSFNDKTIDVETARLTLTQTKVSDRTLVLGNGVEIVLYKGKLSAGDSDDVTLKDLTLTGSIKTSTGVAITAYDYEDILDDVTLNIGGKTFDGDINSSNVEFNSINAVIAAGSDNVEVTVTAVLKDTDDVNNGDKLVLDNVAITAEDSENEDLVSGNVGVTATSTDTTLVLNEQGSLDFKMVQNGDNKDEIDDVVLAGTNGVAIAEVELEANEENVKVKELVFTASGDVSNTLADVRLVNGSNVIVDGAVITYSGSMTYITFKNDFTIDTASNKVKALLVADLNTITTEGGEVTATAGDLFVKLNTVEAKWVASNEDIFANGDTTKAVTSTVESLAVSVVPALVTVSIVDEMGSNDSDAIIRFTIDKGNNDLDNSDILVKSIALETAVAGSGVTVRNDDNTTLVANSNASTIDLTSASADLRKIVNGDEFELKVSDDNAEVRVKAKGIIVTIDGADYTISNDKVIDLGEYDAN